MRYLHNLTPADYRALAQSEYYRIDSSRRVLRFGLNGCGVPELAEFLIGGVEELKARLKARKRRENAAKRAIAMKEFLDWRAILARRK